MYLEFWFKIGNPLYFLITPKTILQRTVLSQGINVNCPFPTTNLCLVTSTLHITFRVRKHMYIDNVRAAETFMAIFDACETIFLRVAELWTFFNCEVSDDFYRKIFKNSAWMIFKAFSAPWWSFKFIGSLWIKILFEIWCFQNIHIPEYLNFICSSAIWACSLSRK